VLVNPHDERALCDAMDRVLSDPQLRASLRERGLRHVQQFSWERTAELTLEAYAEASEAARAK
jgi:D-inositol-3-phosphate glycosyltransferase